MPCTKCKEGKYKWGKTGECEYATKEACESANHKYNNMNPTPLGKKTYAEYAKELKEYNLSSAYKVELKDVKTLDKLAAQLESITEKLDKDLGKIEDLVFNYNKAEDEYKEQRDILDRAEDVVELNKQEVVKAQKLVDSSVKDMDKQEKKWNKTFDKTIKTEDKLVGANEKYKSNYDKGEALKNKLKSAVKEVQAQLKALGVKDNPQALQNGEWSIEEFDKQVPDAAKYFKY
tara:strand:- start:901 stop:1596 length:696 start_codon:yes stop_codon:yes gene_type:complete